MIEQISYTISNMNKDDIPDIVKLEELSFGKHHWAAESFYNELKNNLAHYYTVKTQKKEIAGYIGFWLIFEEAHITTLSVNPKFRRKKIAQILFSEMLECCYNNMVKFITLEVRESNIPAICLYEKLGFKSVGVRKGYYQDNNENALIMFTNNIFYSQFKENYAKIKESLKLTEVIYDKSYKR